MSDTDREKLCVAAAAPTGMSAGLTGYEWARDTVGESGAAVYRLHGKADAPDLFLKHGKGAIANDVTDEMARLHWLSDLLPVPDVRHFTRTPDEAWLLMSAMPGRTACQIMEMQPGTRLSVVDAMAAFLRRLHAIPVNTCPFNSDHAYRLALARERIDAGMVEVDDFDEERQGWTAEQVWEAIQSLLPFAPDPVVTHGDFSLDNLFIHASEVVGCIDAGRVGIADRYQDLAIIWNCLGGFGPSLQIRFMQQYGLVDADRHKLQFHLMLDELF